MTKATDLKTIFLKNGCRNMCHTLIFVLKKRNFFNIYLTFFLAFLSTLPSTQTIKVIDLIFFSNELALKKLGYFLWGALDGPPPPPSIHRFRPPNLY